MAVVPFWLNALGKIPEGQSTLTKGVLFMKLYIRFCSSYQSHPQCIELSFLSLRLSLNLPQLTRVKLRPNCRIAVKSQVEMMTGKSVNLQVDLGQTRICCLTPPTIFDLEKKNQKGSGPLEGRNHHKWTLKNRGVPLTIYVLNFRKSERASGSPCPHETSGPRVFLNLKLEMIKVILS